jgi:2-hydroxy-6-oxonona-2,4-dienedioate hydrolase
VEFPLRGQREELVAEHESVWSDLQGVPFVQGYLEAGGVRTRYLHAGDLVNPTLILLHGSGGHAEAYVRNLEAHAEHFSTWSIDMLGHGYTDKPGHPLEIHHYIEHLLAFLDAIGVQRAHLSGESLGGWIVARVAADHPDKVDRLVLNTAGGSQADLEVMKRIITLSMAAAEDPNWETVQARIKWLMSDKSKGYDDLVASRRGSIANQASFRRCATSWRCKTPRSGTVTCSAPTTTVRSPRPPWCCGPATTRPPMSPRAAESRR